MDQGEKLKRKPCPKENANVFSIISFFYTLKVFIKGFRRDLEEEDIYQVIKKLNSKKLGDNLEQQWLREKGRKRKLSLLRVIWFCYGKRFLFYGSCELFMKLGLSLILPFGTGRLVKYFSKKDEEEVSIDDAYMYAALVIGTKFVHMFCLHNYMLLVMEMGVLVRTAFCSMIYRKCLRLTPRALNDFTTGKIVTLMTRDVQVIDTFMMHGNDIWIAVIQATVITCFLYARIGFAALVGVGIFLLVIPIAIYVGKVAGSMRISTCKKTDIRLQTTQEALSAIKIIKMYTWEAFFADKISAARKAEIVKIRMINCLKWLTFVIGFMMSHISFYILLITYIKYGIGVSAENIFYASESFDYLRFSIALAIPYSVTQIAELGASLKRLGDLMNAEELPKPVFNTDPGLKPKVVLNNATFKIKDKLILNNVSTTISSGLNIVTGPLGSGKSSLLKVILQDYPLTEGHLLVQGTVSYACQDPWLFPGSIKHNILFGEELNEARYQNVIRVCALKYDLDILANGDETIVEDRGMNLSKGQQARINLARAIYRESDIYLLDDCLAALDTTVQEHIFQECIKEFLKGKICLWVSHSVKSIKEADQVIIMSHGTIKSVGKSKDINEKEILQMMDDNKTQKRKSLIECDCDEKEDCTDENSELLKTETEYKENLYKEVKKVGGVDFEVYKKYFGFGGGILTFGFVVILFTTDQFCFNTLDKIMSLWVNSETNLTKLIQANETNSTEYLEMNELGKSQLNWYFIMLVLAHLMIVLRAVVYFFYVSRISINMHKQMIVKVINASMEFFDNTFIGNILNRFSRDLATIDDYLQMVISECFRVSFQASGTFLLIATVNPWYMVPSVIICLVLFAVRRLYIPTGRSLKRLDSATRSPVIGHLNATLEGLTTIRAYGRQAIVTEEFDKHQDLYTSASHLSLMTSRALAAVLNFLTIIYTVFIILHLLFGDPLAGDAGLVLSQATKLTGILQWGVRQWSYLENQMTSVERSLEYTKMKQEDTSGQELEDWPKEGSMEYKKVSLTYEKTKETVLRNINVSIHSKGKIGIVGRTGAGKSSIISTIFRLYKVDGKILIDNVDTSTVALKFLRSSISIIPQDPVLFRGTIRENIDPFGNFTDEQIWRVLDTVKLKEVTPDLEFEVADGGTQFSAGQRQLMCLARSLIRKNKIIILDEATANMDPETDVLIEKIIKDEFADCTVLTIAHKLDSIMDSDKVMVLDRGQVVEYDTPVRLVQNKDSLFRSMSQRSS